MFEGETDELETLNCYLEQARSSHQSLGRIPILSYLSVEPVDMNPFGNFQRNPQPELYETANLSEAPLQ